MIIKRPKRNDGASAKRWRGPLFFELASLMWKEGDHYEFLQQPKSVTFPICYCCGHVIWDWPHYEEPVPDEACCDACEREEGVSNPP